MRFLLARQAALLAALLCVCSASGGCAAFSNPVAEGIPVHRLPPEYLAPPKEDLKTIPLTWLRQPIPESHRVDAGDVLGVYIEGVLGAKDLPPPVHLPDQNVQKPSVGYPVVVDEDGKMPLPYIPPLNVKNMTIPQVRDAIIKAYTVDRDIIKAGKEPGTAKVQILVSLLRPRHFRVQVVRQDTTTAPVAPNIYGSTRRGTGTVVELPAYENDVLNALTRTGGLPGLDAINEVIVERGDPFKNSDDPAAKTKTRIPLRMKEGEPVPFQQDDVILKNGDIIFIEARDTEVYYTGGLLQARQFILPRDYDLTVVDAVSQAGGPLVDGGINQNNFTGQVIATGLGSPSPSRVTVLRRTKDNGQIPIIVNLNKALNDRRENILIQASDVIIAQETLGEAMARYFSSAYHFNAINVFSNVPNLTGTNSFMGP